MLSHVTKREFQFHTSVFKGWHKETAQKVKDSIDSDCQMWKLKKFINKKGEENEVSSYLLV